MRDVRTILAEWRALERELRSNTDGERQVMLTARVEALRLEYAAALDELDVEAHALGTLRKPKRPPPSEG